jgi:energy-converting hydrogenase Eha subunit A
MSELMKVTMRVHPLMPAIRRSQGAQMARVGIESSDTTSVILPTAILAIGSTALLFSGYFIIGAAGLIATPFVYMKLNEMNS